MAYPLQWSPSMTARRALHDERGFTLVEMVVVVAIIGILAVLAVVGYRKLITSSHTAEATGMVTAIRAAQESYQAEVMQYADISPDINTTYPIDKGSVGMVKTAWGFACGSACKTTTWAMLPVHVDAPVMFGYATTAGPAGTAPRPTSVTVNNQAVTFPTTSTLNWFVIGAYGKPDGQTLISVYGDSWSNDILVDND